jgi:hypothetical protein
MTKDPTRPALESIWLRVLRGAVACALALALTIIAGLVVLGFLPLTRNSLAPLFSADQQTSRLALALAILFVILVPTLLLFWPFLRRALRARSTAAAGGQPPGGANRRRRTRWLGWPVLGIGWAAVLPVLVWLAWDEPAVRQPVSIEEFSPVFPGAEKSFAVLMQYSTKNPGPEARAFAAAKLVVPGFGANPQDPDRWLSFVNENRAGLEADWAVLAPQRRWLDELAAFDRIGDLTPAGISAEIVKFQPWRALSYHACGIATLQALNGHGDDAIATLLPLLEVSRKLQPTSRTLVRSLIAEVAERMTLQTTLIVLDHATVSEATRRRLSAVLANENAPAMARRLIMEDFVQFWSSYLTMKLGDAIVPDRGLVSCLHGPLNLLSALFLNPNATVNLYGDHVRELAALAEERDLRQFATRNWSFGDEALLEAGLKNLGGRLMVNRAVPAYDKALEMHWKVADLRAAVRQRLAEPPAKSPDADS